MFLKERHNNVGYDKAYLVLDDVIEQLGEMEKRYTPGKFDTKFESAARIKKKKNKLPEFIRLKRGLNSRTNLQIRFTKNRQGCREITLLILQNYLS